MNIFIDAKNTTPESLDDKFLRFLIERGIAAPHDKTILSQFLTQEIPEFAALPAVRELREQFRSPKVEIKKLYPGRRAGIDPISFLLYHYGDEIKCGELGPGRLAVIDKNLYTSTRQRLAGDIPSMTMDEFFQNHRDTDKQTSRHHRRLLACAQLLNEPDIEDAARFFGNIRPSRMRVNERDKISSATSR